MANKFIGETSGKYWKQKNDETYVNEDELVKITDLDESDSVEDDDLLIKGNSSTGKMLRIKVANFLDGIKGKLLGNTDISSVGDGTVTGAISENAKNISANKDDADSKYNELNSALANLLATDVVTVDNITVSASDTNVITATVTKSGYTPLGIIGYMITNASSGGTASSRLFPYECRLLNSTTARMYVRNTYSSDAKVDIYFYVLYAAD